MVWETQGAGNVNLFIKEFKLKLIDCFKQDWHAVLGSNDFYNVYSNFNQSLALSQYLRTLNNIKRAESIYWMQNWNVCIKMSLPTV